MSSRQSERIRDRLSDWFATRRRKMELATNEVHVWRGRLTSSFQTRQELRDLLSPDEFEHASRFNFDLHREQYTIGRGLLRIILSMYTDVPPDRIAFEYTQYGKPFLRDALVQFNVSHSHGLALYALAKEKRLGVDVEWMRPMRDQEAIARQFFSQAEYKDWLSLDPSIRNVGFFNCWTRKEAYLKAVGSGLYTPLDSFEVSLKPDTAAVLNSIDGRSLPASQWSLFHLNPGQDFVGALAIYGNQWDLRHVCWSEASSLVHSLDADLGILLS